LPRCGSRVPDFCDDWSSLSKQFPEAHRCCAAVDAESVARCQMRMLLVNHLEVYVDGNVHTNGVENFWSLLKRAIGSTYVAEQAFRFHQWVAAINS
jgi:hypothetical protein